IELFAGTLLIVWHIGLAVYISASLLHSIIAIGLPFLFFLVLVKTFITLFLILQWLNEYYEISADIIKYRRGIIFRRVEDYPTADIKFIDVEQGIFGRMFNFGTVTLMNIRRIQYAQMYLIHNPLRYAQILEDLVPNLVERRHVLRRHFHENGENTSEAEVI